MKNIFKRVRFWFIRNDVVDKFIIDGIDVKIYLRHEFTGLVFVAIGCEAGKIGKVTFSTQLLRKEAFLNNTLVRMLRRDMGIKLDEKYYLNKK